jgi:hypothetical protein
MNLIYAKPTVAVHRKDVSLDGLRTFEHFFNMFNWSVFPVDRTGTIRFPVRTTSLFPLPAIVPFSKSYEEICNARASELLQRMSALGCRMHVFWSGGIDSTLVLVSLLKNATAEQKEFITVLLSEESLAENPEFYKRHIRGILKTDSSMLLPYVIGGKDIVVNGEHNDQVFGSGAIGRMIQSAGIDIVHQSYSRDLFFRLFNAHTHDVPVTNLYLDLFERLKAAAPVPVTTNFDYLWWINFALKWQTVYSRTLSFVSARNRECVTPEYLRTYYAPFYNTEDFQLWSMTNPDKKMKDTWKTYKWPCKDIIYAFDGNKEYRDNKTKRNSLVHVIEQQSPFPFIDAQWNFRKEMDASDYYDPESDLSRGA